MLLSKHILQRPVHCCGWFLKMTGEFVSAQSKKHSTKSSFLDAQSDNYCTLGNTLNHMKCDHNWKWTCLERFCFSSPMLQLWYNSAYLLSSITWKYFFCKITVLKLNSSICAWCLKSVAMQTMKVRVNCANKRLWKKGPALFKVVFTYPPTCLLWDTFNSAFASLYFYIEFAKSPPFFWHFYCAVFSVLLNNSEWIFITNESVIVAPGIKYLT